MADVKPDASPQASGQPVVPTVAAGMEHTGQRNRIPWVTAARENRLLLGPVALTLGIFLIVVATAFMTNFTGEYRVGVAAMGILVVYYGLDAVLKLCFGDQIQTGLWLAGIWLALIALAAIFADFLPLAEAKDATVALQEGTGSRLRPDLFSQHPFGTSTQALDVLGGVIYGARISLHVSLLAVAIGIVVGGVIGVVAGFFQKQLDAVIGVLTDAVLAFPPLILLLALATVLEANPNNIALALAALGIPTYIRLSRANTLVFVQREFVLAAVSMGARRSRIIFKELVPNVALPLVSYAFIIVAVLIVAEASLSFLGLGIKPPEPTWGNMIAAGQDDFERLPHLVFIPGIVMFLTVFSLNRVGEQTRQLWDPRVSNL